MNRRIMIPLLIAAFLTVETGVNGQQSTPPPESNSRFRRETGDGQRQLQALRSGYPHTVGAVRYIDGDWTIDIGDQRFYWAQGRLLPQEARADYERYASIRFYNYYRGPLHTPILTAAQEARVRRLFNERSGATGARITRHNAFLDALYDIHSRRDAEQTLVTVQFLGHQTVIHPFLRAPLRKVEQKILRRIGSDAELRAFIADLHSVSGYVWRAISGTSARSYHSYGAAVDLLHNAYGSHHVYWRWSAEQGTEEWWQIPIANRWSPPGVLIDIFESEGFVWGGKWLLFDTVHFEYRPEIFHLIAQ